MTVACGGQELECPCRYTVDAPDIDPPAVHDLQIPATRGHPAPTPSRHHGPGPDPRNRQLPARTEDEFSPDRFATHTGLGPLQRAQLAQRLDLIGTRATTSACPAHPQGADGTACCLVGGRDDSWLLGAGLRRPRRRLRAHGEVAGVRVVRHGGNVPGELGGDGRPPLAQGGAGGRELPGPFGDQRADRCRGPLARVPSRRTAVGIRSAFWPAPLQETYEQAQPSPPRTTTDGRDDDARERADREERLARVSASARGRPCRPGRPARTARGPMRAQST